MVEKVTIYLIEDNDSAVAQALRNFGKKERRNVKHGLRGRTFDKWPSGVYKLQHVQDTWQAWQARAAQSEWISVEERLPEAHDDILVYTCDGDIYPILAICRDITWIGISGATHWQHLPLCPQGSAFEE